MVLDPRKKQKQVERRKAKDKVRHEDLKRQARLEVARERALMAVSPIISCQMHDELWKIGLGPVIVVREMPDGRRVVGIFLVDTFCLGVKNAIFDVQARSEYAEHRQRLEDCYTLRDIAPEYARALVEGSIAYARDLGLMPHSDYEQAKIVLESIDMSGFSEQFQFGQNGKPCYVCGPEDGYATQNRILTTLRKRCGPGNFQITVSQAY